MTNPGNSPEPPKKGFKLTLMQGMIGAVSLAGTTAVPIIVQRALTPPTPPTQTPAQITPAQMTPVLASPQDATQPVEPDDDSKGKDKKKGKKHN